MHSIAEIENRAKCIRLEIVKMIGPGKTGHFGGSLSVADIISALYFGRMRYDPENPSMFGRDRLIMSKGHAAPAQYAALAIAGFFEKHELSSLKKLGSRLQGHPDRKLVPGIEASTGSLGQGLSMGVGIALGMRIRGEPGRVYVVFGDGELQEGQVWEAAMAAASYRLDRLIAVVDHNKLQATGEIASRLDIGSLAAKWKAFGWYVCEANGHDARDLMSAFDEIEATEGVPGVVIAHTVKGKGVSFIENVPAYHNGALTQEEYEAALSELSR